MKIKYTTKPYKYANLCDLTSPSKSLAHWRCLKKQGTTKEESTELAGNHGVGVGGGFSVQVNLENENYLKLTFALTNWKVELKNEASNPLQIKTTQPKDQFENPEAMTL